MLVIFVSMLSECLYSFGHYFVCRCSLIPGIVEILIFDLPGCNFVSELLGVLNHVLFKHILKEFDSCVWLVFVKSEESCSSHLLFEVYLLFFFCILLI